MFGASRSVVNMERRKRERVRDACKRGNFKGLLGRARSSKSSKVLEEPFERDLSQPLHYAAALGNLEVVREFVESYDCDPMCENRRGITPLHCASYCGKVDVVKYLQELYGTDTIIVDDWFNRACPIAYCTYCLTSREMAAPLDHFQRSVSPNSGHVETAKYLLRLRIQNDQKDEMSPELMRVLRLPMHCDSLADLQCLIEILAQFEFQAESVEYSIEIYKCLGSAVYHNKWDFARALLSAYPEPIKVAARVAEEESSSSNQSFMHTLFKYADIDLIKLFLEFEICKPNLLSLKWAIDDNCYELVEHLFKSADHLPIMGKHDHKEIRYSSLLSYVFSSHQSHEQRLVKLIADYNGADDRDIDGNTVLHLACEYSVAYLVEDNSYDQSAVNSSGQMPLHVACKHGNLKIIKLVSSQPGLDINFQDSEGNTPLHVACKSNWDRTADTLSCFKYLLLEMNCNINVQNNLKDLPFHVLLKNSDSIHTNMVNSILAMCNSKDISINQSTLRPTI